MRGPGVSPLDGHLHANHPHLSAERLGHETNEKALKAEMLALATDHEEIRLPYGIKVNIKQQSRGAYQVKPTTFKTVKAYVPADVPQGNIGDIDVK